MPLLLFSLVLFSFSHFPQIKRGDFFDNFLLEITHLGISIFFFIFLHNKVVLPHKYLLYIDFFFVFSSSSYCFVLVFTDLL